MRKVFLLISFAALIFSSVKLSAQTPTDKYGPNSAECLKYISYYEEYYKLNNTDLYVSSGIGTSNISFRLFNKPSFNLYRLNKTE